MTRPSFFVYYYATPSIHSRQLIIAIDGPAGSGKSTTARAVADRLGYRYLDTGAMYRAVAFAVRRAGVRPEASEVVAILNGLKIGLEYGSGRARVHLNGEEVTTQIRDAETGALASHVATFPEVRRALVAEQRRLAREYEASDGGVVVDGRDIGSHVFPEAELKVFMVADPRVRAQRRQAEMEAAGQIVSIEEVLAEIEARDRLDESRAVAPLVQAEDAVALDSTQLTIDEQVTRVVALARERTNHPAV